MIYAGIGSRQAPPEILGLCTRIAHRLRGLGDTLRTGHAIGCDQAFERGAEHNAEVFLPWRDYEQDVYVWGRLWPMPTIEAIQMVPKYHPAPERLSMAAVRLHARNLQILLGPVVKLDPEPVDRVICWTADEKRGGTAFGIRAARELGIPVHNLHDPFVRAGYEHLCR